MSTVLQSRDVFEETMVVQKGKTVRDSDKLLDWILSIDLPIETLSTLKIVQEALR